MSDLHTLFGTFDAPEPKPTKTVEREREREALRLAGSARDRAIDRVQRASEPRDEAALMDALDRVIAQAGDGGEFTAEDVWRAVGGRERIGGDGRLLGAVMRRFARAGLCRSTERVKKSGSAVNHNRPITVWQATPSRKARGA